MSGAAAETKAVESVIHGRAGAPCPSRLDALVGSPSRAAWWGAAGAGAIAIHSAVLLSIATLGRTGNNLERAPAPVTQMVEVELPPPPPPPEPEPVEQEPPPEVVPPPPTVKPAPRPRAVKPPPPPKPEPAPPPAAAEAGKVLEAANPAAAAESVVSGEAQQHAGGVTESGGTSKAAVRDLSARAGGVPGGTGTDLARQPQLAGGAQWDCPFPMEADDEGIDHAVVTLRVEVAADGGVANVQTSNDPGYGFAREARRCASRKRWAPGLDSAGQPIAAVALVRVRFDR